VTSTASTGSSETPAGSSDERGVAGEPLVSVVLPIHNGEEYLSQAIESVLGQDVERLELIVVDDASSDSSARIARGYGDRLRYLRVPKQPTSIATTNVGMSAARGRYLCVTHQDDYLLPGKLRRHVELMERDPDIGFSYSAQWFVGPRGEPLKKLRSPLREGDYIVAGTEELRHLAVQNFLNYCNVVMRRTAYEAAGPFDEPLWVSADWGLWLRMALRYRVGYIDDLLVCYRLHPAAQTIARTQDADDWRTQALAAVDAFYATPGLPADVRSRQELTEASVDLTVGLLDAIHGRAAPAVTALRQVVRRVGWGALPGLVHSAVIVPRAASRARMVLDERVWHPRPAWSDGVAFERRGEVLTCPRCDAVAAYEPFLASRSRKAASGGPVRLRCLVCGYRWERTLEANSAVG